MSSNEPEKRLTPKFNELSWFDRAQLTLAGFTNGITGVIRDDTEKRPWMYPFYAAYLVVMVTPLPFPFASTILAAATAVFLKFPFTPWTRWANGEMKKAFNEAAREDYYKEVLRPHADDPERTFVSMWALTKKTTRRSWEDTKIATRHAWKALGNFLGPS